MRLYAVVALLLLAGCASADRISLIAAPSQQSLTRDGVPTLFSYKHQVVMLRPVEATIRRGQRPTFIVAVYNRNKVPTELSVRNISAAEMGVANAAPIRVYTYDELVAETRRKQAWAAFGVALAGAAGAMSAANAGYTHTYGSYSGYSTGSYSGALNGTYSGTTMGTYSATTYDPGRAYAAQAINNAQTAANMAAIQASGEQRLGELQATILKDNTVMPGEWVGGVIVLDTPDSGSDGVARYHIDVVFGGEVHSFSVAQARSA